MIRGVIMKKLRTVMLYHVSVWRITVIMVAMLVMITTIIFFVE